MYCLSPLPTHHRFKNRVAPSTLFTEHQKSCITFSGRPAHLRPAHPITLPRQWLGTEGRSQDALGKYNIASELPAAPMGVYFSMIRPNLSNVALPEHVIATRSFPIGDGSTGPGPSRGGGGGGGGGGMVGIGKAPAPSPPSARRSGDSRIGDHARGRPFSSRLCERRRLSWQRLHN